MGGSWTSQNKILPGAYINFLTNTALSITPGERGIVVLLQEMSVGSAGEMYAVTATDASGYPSGVSDADKVLVNQALKGARTVIVYNLGKAHDSSTLTNALDSLKTVDFNTLCYPFAASTHAASQAAIKTWITAMRDIEGRKIQSVLADYTGDSEAVINVTQGVKISDGTTLTSAQTTAWVAGVTAGASIYQSNTGKKYTDAIDVVPRMTKSEMEAAVSAGKFIFKVDSAQNVTAVYDINSLVSFTVDKGEMFRKNRVMRTIDGINNDIVEIFEANYVGKTNNNADGRALLRATLVQYFTELQNLSAIQNFTEADVMVSAGIDSDAVVIESYVQPVDSVEKIYITVNLA